MELDQTTQIVIKIIVSCIYRMIWRYIVAHSDKPMAWLVLSDVLLFLIFALTMYPRRRQQPPPRTLVAHEERTEKLE